MSSGGIRCEELRPELWQSLERLFGPNGACAGCWCMWWRAEPGLWKQLQGTKAKRAFKRLVESGAAHVDSCLRTLFSRNKDWLLRLALQFAANEPRPVVE